MSKRLRPAGPAAKSRKTATVLSTRTPDSEDLQCTAALEDTMQALGCIPELEAVRAATVHLVEACVSAWVRDVAINIGLSQEQVAQAGCKLLPLGSCALGAPGPSSDVDCVAVVPYFVNRQAFFAADGLSARLQRDLKGLDVGSLHPVPAAFVPVIKFVVDNVPVDLLLARLRLPQIPATLSAEDPGLLARCMEEADVHSLNGARVAGAILRRVPDQARFRTTLRAVKLWARRRGLDQQSCGYPGGVGWALLTARICQLHPNAAPSTLLDKFFLTWTIWRFGDPDLGISEGLPVLLDDPAATSAASTASAEEPPLPPHLAGGMSEWTPRDRGSLMPIITPCKPRLNSTHTISRSTLALLKDEIKRASALAAQARSAAGRASALATGAASSSSAWAADERWAALFEPLEFFAAYPHFVVVEMAAATGSELAHWRAYIKARLHRLVLQIEKVPGVEAVHPLPWPLCAPAVATTELVKEMVNTAPGAEDVASTQGARSLCSSFFLGLRFAPGAGERPMPGDARYLDLRPAVVAFGTQINAWADKAALCPSAKAAVRHTPRADIPANLGRGACLLPFDDPLDAIAITSGCD